MLPAIMLYDCGSNLRRCVQKTCSSACGISCYILSFTIPCAVVIHTWPLCNCGYLEECDVTVASCLLCSEPQKLLERHCRMFLFTPKKCSRRRTRCVHRLRNFPGSSHRLCYNMLVQKIAGRAGFANGTYGRLELKSYLLRCSCKSYLLRCNFRSLLCCKWSSIIWQRCWK